MARFEPDVQAKADVGIVIHNQNLHVAHLEASLSAVVGKRLGNEIAPSFTSATESSKAVFTPKQGALSGLATIEINLEAADSRARIVGGTEPRRAISLA